MRVRHLLFLRLPSEKLRHLDCNDLPELSFYWWLALLKAETIGSASTLRLDTQLISERAYLLGPGGYRYFLIPRGCPLVS